MVDMFKTVSVINYFIGTTCTQLCTDHPLGLLACKREAINTQVAAAEGGAVGTTMDVINETQCIRVDYCINTERRYVVVTLSQVPVGKHRYRNKLAMYYVTNNSNLVCVLEHLGPVLPGTCTLESGTTTMRLE